MLVKLDKQPFDLRRPEVFAPKKFQVLTIRKNLECRFSEY